MPTGAGQTTRAWHATSHEAYLRAHYSDVQFLPAVVAGLPAPIQDNDGNGL